MPLKVDITKTSMQRALNQSLASLKRANTNEINPLIRDLREKDIAEIAHALNTITETK